MVQCIRHYVPVDTEYSRFKTLMSEVTMVSEGNSAFLHVDVGEYDQERTKGRAYPPQVMTINYTPRREDMTLMRELEPPLEAPPNPLLIWERYDGGETSSEERDDSDTQPPLPDDVIETSGDSIVPPAAKRKRVIRVELVHVPKRGYGPPTPPPVDSDPDGPVPEHERTQDDHMRMMYERLTCNSLEIMRRDAMPKPKPPQPPPPKQPATEADAGWVNNMPAWGEAVERAVMMAKAEARAKNASNAEQGPEASVAVESMPDRGPVPTMKPPPTSRPKEVPKPFFAEPYYSHDDTPDPSAAVERMPDRGPVPIMKPPPTSRPKEVPKPFFAETYYSDDDKPDQQPTESADTAPPPGWENRTAEAAKKARALIETVKSQLLSTNPPYFKMPPKGVGCMADSQPKGPPTKPKPSCPVLGAIVGLNGSDPLPPPPKPKPSTSGISTWYKCAYGIHCSFRWANVVSTSSTTRTYSHVTHATVESHQCCKEFHTCSHRGNDEQWTAQPANTDSCAAAETRYRQPSAVVMRIKCHHCKTTDEPNYPLEVCWYESKAGVKCGKRFCYNSRQKCRSRVAYIDIYIYTIPSRQVHQESKTSRTAYGARITTILCCRAIRTRGRLVPVYQRRLVLLGSRRSI
eukprot:6458193-Amphidinium_carterae.2